MRRLADSHEEIRTVAERWKSQYFSSDGHWFSLRRGDSAEFIHSRLAALPASATEQDVADIIGNDGWVGGYRCTECQERAVVLVGEEPDVESRTVYLCRSCAEKVIQLCEVVS